MLAAFFRKHGIIKIARIDAVDGHKRQMAQIQTVFIIRRTQFIVQFRHLLFRFRGKFMGNIVIGNRHRHFHARRQRFAEHGNHFADRLLVTPRIIRDFHQHNLAVFRPAARIGRDDNRLGQTAVFRHDGKNTVAFAQLAHHTLLPAFKNFYRRIILAPVRADKFDPRQNAVAMHQFLHVFGRNKAVRLVAVRREKAVTFGVRNHLPAHQIHFPGNAVAPLTVAQQLSAADHRFQTMLQKFAAFFAKRKGFGNLARSKQLPLLGQPAQ